MPDDALRAVPGRFSPALGRTTCGRWQRLRRRLAYWLLSRVDPVIANRKLKFLV